MELKELPLYSIVPDTSQPRRDFDLSELKDSILENGVLVPIIVEPSENGEKLQYLIIDGERRYRSSKELGLSSIPAVINKSVRKNRFKDQLVIDHQRHSLTVEEKSAAWSRLLDEYDGSYGAVAKAVGVSVSQVKNVIEGAQFKARVGDLLPDDLGWRERAVIRRTNRIKDDNLRAKLIIAAIENEDVNKLIDDKVKILSIKSLDEKKLTPAEQKIIINAKDIDEAIISIRNMREEMETEKSSVKKAKKISEDVSEKTDESIAIKEKYTCPHCNGTMTINDSLKNGAFAGTDEMTPYQCDGCASIFVLLMRS